MNALNRFRTLSIVAMSVLCATTALADHYYDGPAVDINFQATKPAKYAQCDKYIQDNNPLGLSATDYARRYASCEFGRDEADRMAERFGGGNGKIAGFLRGYSWGLYKSAKAYENDGEEMKRAEAAVDGMGDTMKAGLEAGRRAGESAGRSAGNHDAIDRFLQVLNSGRTPDPTIRVPETNYQGEDGAYQKYVGAVPTMEDILKKETNVGELRVYSSYDSLYLGDLKPVSIWDLWFGDGVYRFEKALWYDKTAAFSTWKSRPLDTKPKFEALNIPPATYKETITHPNPVAGQPPITEIVTRTLDLQLGFKDGFVGSYEWYINYYFAQKFYEWMDEGQRDGEQVGILAGKRVAFYKGLVWAYNKKFKESSKLTYRNGMDGRPGYVQAYNDEFTKVFNHYMNNAILTLAFKSITGEINDGIIQPGELISATFNVRNLGGVGSALNASISGDVTDTKTQAFQIGKLMSSDFTADDIAKIDSRLNPRDTARLVLNVNGLTSGLNQIVQRMIEVGSVAPHMDITAGSGDIQVSLTNIATQRTPDLITATLTINGKTADTKNVGVLEPGNERDVTLEYKNIDPFELIGGTSNSVQAKVIISMGDLVLDTRALNLASTNRDRDLAKYFNQLADGKGFVPSRVNREDRLADALAMIANINNSETRNHKNLGKVWKRDAGSTMIGKVRDQFIATNQSETARDAYDALAKRLWESRRNLPKFLFIKGAKRKAFETLCREIARSGRLR